MISVTAGIALPVLWLVGVGEANARPPHSASSTVMRTGPAGRTATRQSNLSTNGTPNGKTGAENRTVTVGTPVTQPSN